MRYNSLTKSFLGVLFLFGAMIGLSAISLAQQKSDAKKKTSPSEFMRPKPTRPVTPMIPSVDRYTTSKIFLEKADSLYKRETDVREHQIVRGGVTFRQGNMWMFCDSAFYYPDMNSLDAFGNVKMQQGDTLFVYADKLFYDGDREFARLRCGPSRKNVQLVNRNVTLTTDSLDYDLIQKLGWYAHGGKIDDKVNVLTSVYGQYSPATKDADFYHNVELRNIKNGNRLLTDTLYYNTKTHIARIVSPTRIYGLRDTILTSSGWYNTVTDNANLNSRSTIIHKDTANNVTTLTGDSIIYDRKAKISKAYMFRDRRKMPQPMVINDTARKAILIGGFGLYNEGTREAFASEYPLLIEYSRPDTLFLRADTIFSMMESRKVFAGDTVPMLKLTKRVEEEVENDNGEMIRQTKVVEELIPDSSKMVAKDFHIAKAYHRARFFNQELQGVADSMTFIEFDSMLYLNRKPVVWSGEREVYGNEIHVHFQDTAPDWAYLPNYGMMGEHVGEEFYNQLTGKEMKAFFENKNLKHLDVSGNVQTIFLPMENDSTYNRLVYAESSFLSIDLDSMKLDRLKMWPEVTGTVIPLFLVKKNQILLPGFKWLDDIRPVREWYGNRLHWADNLGEVTEELDAYFKDNTMENIGRRFTQTGSEPPSNPNPVNTESVEIINETVTKINL